MRCRTERHQQLPSDTTLSKSDMLFAGDGAFWLAQTGRVGLTAQSPVSDRFPRAGAQQLNL